MAEPSDERSGRGKDAKTGRQGRRQDTGKEARQGKGTVAQRQLEPDKADETRRQGEQGAGHDESSPSMANKKSGERTADNQHKRVEKIEADEAAQGSNVDPADKAVRQDVESVHHKQRKGLWGSVKSLVASVVRLLVSIALWVWQFLKGAWRWLLARLRSVFRWVCVHSNSLKVWFGFGRGFSQNRFVRLVAALASLVSIVLGIGLLHWRDQYQGEQDISLPLSLLIVGGFLLVYCSITGSTLQSLGAKGALLRENARLRYRLDAMAGVRSQTANNPHDGQSQRQEEQPHTAEPAAQG
ncbi:hypothetical protein CRD60_01420 [Bifidobacterium aemilianum]|uniref:Transmembrane protein n=1 Tax=Bifidobacterium aemilianum TaxID=2493120 RepID=A0A366K9X5_9BIFI|nr:hypothetical protein [Bifidobacterium aemilianum]RBP98545.1 hypothetical protein CRD60_01420 [Bifidobacterium aemilianum]